MTKLEEIKNGASVAGVIPNQSVEVVSVDWIGDQALNLVYRIPDGSVLETTLYRDDEHRLSIEQRGRAWSFDADGSLLRLATEANRIKLAHCFDPYLAIHTSLVDPLPHQISAVYGEMLPRQPLLFLLADDPGAGKTIMAGLLIKELIAQSDLERCLVVAPGSLVEQWQDEPGEKFLLECDIHEQYDHLMKRGAILVDDTDPNQEITALFLLEHSVQDGRPTATGKPHIISERLQFAVIDGKGEATNAGIAPHLNLRSAKPEEIALAPQHVAGVKARRLPEIDKVEQEVRAPQEGNQPLGCKDVRTQGGRVGRTENPSELAKRSAPCGESGGAPEAPHGSAGARKVCLGPASTRAWRNGGYTPRIAQNTWARREIELKAMAAVINADTALGNTPTDVSAQKTGYDIASCPPRQTTCASSK